MIAYLDSSVVLRMILGQRDKLRAWKKIEHGVASALVQVECLRTLDRLRLRAGLSDEDLAERRIGPLRARRGARRGSRAAPGPRPRAAPAPGG